MRIFELFLIGCSFLLLVSCGAKKSMDTVQEVYVEESSWDGDIVEDTMMLTIREVGSGKLLLFGLEEEKDIVVGLLIEISKSDKSEIIVGKMTAKLIAEKVHAYKGKNLKIRKYYYNVPDMLDEECYYFLADEKLIAVKSVAWGVATFYRYPDLDLIELLKADSISFF